MWLNNHVVILFQVGQVYLEKEKRFDSIRELIGYYHKNHIPLREHTKLTRPYKT